eukprot:1835520-Pyramimonas_sp.AAC.1
MGRGKTSTAIRCAPPELVTGRRLGVDADGAAIACEQARSGRGGLRSGRRRQHSERARDGDHHASR